MVTVVAVPAGGLEIGCVGTDETADWRYGVVAVVVFAGGDNDHKDAKQVRGVQRRCLPFVLTEAGN